MKRSSCSVCGEAVDDNNDCDSNRLEADVEERPSRHLAPVIAAAGSVGSDIDNDEEDDAVSTGAILGTRKKSTTVATRVHSATCAAK